MTLNEKITAKQAELLAARDALVDLVAKSDDTDENAAAITEQTQAVEKLSADLDQLKSAEAAIQKSMSRTPSAAIVKSAPKHKGGNDLVKSALVTFEAFVKRVPVAQIAEERYGNDEAALAVIGNVTKAVQNPAMTNIQGYAEELTREAYGQFMDMLKPESVLPRLPLNSFSFDGATSLNIPYRDAVASPNMAGGFRAEGAPIRVGGLTLGKLVLTPKSLGVIGTFTNELFERSTPSVESVIQSAMISDTAAMLDTAFLGGTVASATAPGGILADAETAVSTGVTAADIIADLRGRVQALAGHNMGRRPVWIMNPARAWGLQLAMTAAGTPLLPEMTNNVLLGIPVVTSTIVPADKVYLVDGAEIFFAGGAPRFMATEMATIHEESVNPDPIDGASPVRSLYQTNSSALRVLWQLDWKVARTGAVQVIESAAW